MKVFKAAWIAIKQKIDGSFIGSHKFGLLKYHKVIIMKFFRIQC